MSGAEYVARRYRELMGARFRSFSASFKETDLWIGVDPGSYDPRMEDFCASMARSLRLGLEAYIGGRPEFLSSLVPIPDDAGAPPIAREMIAAAALAGVGPMAAVAGAVAEAVGSALVREFGCREAAVENGGDLWLRFEEPMAVSVFAGSSALSGRVGISIAPEFSPIGVCTSSGTVGPSLSLGLADAAMVASPSAALADAFATKVGNAVRTEADIQASLDLAPHRAEGRETILSILVVKGGRMGIRGELPLKLFGSAKLRGTIDP